MKLTGLSVIGAALIGAYKRAENSLASPRTRLHSSVNKELNKTYAFLNKLK